MLVEFQSGLQASFQNGILNETRFDVLLGAEEDMADDLVARDVGEGWHG
jgi:hypothetical protein